MYVPVQKGNRNLVFKSKYLKRSNKVTSTLHMKIRKITQPTLDTCLVILSSLIECNWMQVNILLPLSRFSQEVLPRYHASRLQMGHLSARYKTKAWQPRFCQLCRESRASPLRTASLAVFAIGLCVLEIGIHDPHQQSPACLLIYQIVHQALRYPVTAPVSLNLVTHSYITPNGEDGRSNAPCWHVHCLMLIPAESYLLSLLSLVEIIDGLSQLENCFLIDIWSSLPMFWLL